MGASSTRPQLFLDERNSGGELQAFVLQEVAYAVQPKKFRSVARKKRSPVTEARPRAPREIDLLFHNEPPAPFCPFTPLSHTTVAIDSIGMFESIHLNGRPMQSRAVL